MIPATAREGIDAEHYPMTTTELLDRYGDVELDVHGGSERLGDAVERLDPETYETPMDVECAVFAGVTAEAVGRRFYSDRDPMPPGVSDGRDEVSF